MSTARAILALLLFGLTAGVASASPGKVPDPQRSAKPQAVSGSLGAQAVAIAKRYLGIRYVYAAANPKKGFDCSGLTMYVYAKLGIKLTHYSGDQFHAGYRDHAEPVEARRPRLLLRQEEPRHVGIYIGDGDFIHAPQTGDVVKISPLAGHYTGVFSGAVRPYGLGPPIVFPIVGKATYSNTFRSTPKGLLPGNDIIAPKKALVVAAENGTVRFYTKSRKPGACSTSTA